MIWQLSADARWFALPTILYERCLHFHWLGTAFAAPDTTGDFCGASPMVSSAATFADFHNILMLCSLAGNAHGASGTTTAATWLRIAQFLKPICLAPLL